MIDKLVGISTISFNLTGTVSFVVGVYILVKKKK